MSLKNGSESALASLLAYANFHLSLNPEDNVCTYNRISSMLGLNHGAPPEFPNPEDFAKSSPADVIAPFIAAAFPKLTENAERRAATDRIMDLLLPLPSVIMQEFDALAGNEGIIVACEYLYKLSIKSDYISHESIQHTPKWQFGGEKGDITVCVSLDRPEPQPEQTEKTGKDGKHQQEASCALCAAAAHFGGRASLRTIPLFLGDDKWYFQYSMFGYLNEHCTIADSCHTGHAVDESLFKRLTEALDVFPQYFFGCNADIPLISGNFLHHRHFQGGRSELPVLKAPVKMRLSHAGYPSVAIGIVDWYTAAIRIESRDPAALCRLAAETNQSWIGYTDEKAGITNKKERSSALTVLAHITRDGNYCFYLFLRSNDKKFLPSADTHCIKRECLGLFEMSGLFILPARVLTSAERVKDIVTGREKLDFKKLGGEGSEMALYLPMIAQLTNDLGLSATDDRAAEAIETFINKTCERMLKSSTPFPESKEGNGAFAKFLRSSGFIITEQF